MSCTTSLARGSAPAASARRAESRRALVVVSSQPQAQQPARVAGAAPRMLAPPTPALRGLNIGPLAPPAPRSFRPESVLPLLSSAVESSAQVARFESAAGRSAMIGFFVAMLLEAGTEHSLFTTIAAGQAATLAAAAAGCVAAAAAAAAAAASAPAAPRLGAAIHEAVLSSLTATQRAASGVTQHRVDDAVDFVLSSAFAAELHPVFRPLRDAAAAGSAVAAVVDIARSGEDLPH
ncbi:hypothetical protein Rsub_02426 [Raphidocelis subcapitata]|uniref:Uncharacterized protein n=1 Tax=Raphidocelis subcapitata TaxID=307507 RepID=A0A2V0NXK7_9CHLO|nr:hypothetical protein Rsub_02426 [Raphidocelis subcapitata]|eukprot:GBF90320.1 hypothetical protein Rsub_02426 [Raphidocelis subcapitata]